LPPTIRELVTVIIVHASPSRPGGAGTKAGDLASLLPEVNLDLEITGFEPAEIDALMADFGDSGHESGDALCELADQPISKTGDLWQCGPHGYCAATPAIKPIGPV
jgi:hypothetical protein